MIAVVVLDSLNLTRVEVLVAQGRLPAFAALRARGVWHDLEQPLGYFGSWEALYSGRELGDHGHYYTWQWSAEQQGLVGTHRLPAPLAVWDLLGAAGRRSLVIDPFEGWAPAGMEGVFLSGIQLETAYALPRRTVPRGVARTVRRRLGRPPVFDEVPGPISARWLLAVRDRLLAAPSRAAEAACELLAREPFDLVWVGLSAGHLAGHWFWDLSQLRDEQRDADRDRVLLGAVEEVYEAVDEALGRIVAALPDSADLILVSLSGIGPNTSRADLLPGMLQAVLEPGTPAPGPARSRLWRLRAGLPVHLRVGLTVALPNRLRFALIARGFYTGVDWSGVRAFCPPCDTQGFVRLNLRGREREGTVDPGAADALLEEIAEGLLSFRDPDGSPSVSHVHRIFGRTPGERAGQLPDLLVRWGAASSNHLLGVSSPTHGDVRRRSLVGRSGNHVGGDWAIVIPGGSEPSAPLRAPRIADVATTVCSALGVSYSGLAGEPLLVPA